MERRTFIKLLGVVGAAVGFRKGHPAEAPPPPPPITLEAIELTLHQDVLETGDNQRWREYSSGRQWAEWTVQLNRNDPWVGHLSIGRQIEVEGSYGRDSGVYRGRATVTVLQITPTGVIATLVGGKVAYHPHSQEAVFCKTV